MKRSDNLIIDIPRLKKYGVLCVAAADGLDLEEEFYHMNDCLNELHYPELVRDLKIEFEYYTKENIVMILKSDRGAFRIDLMNYVVKKEDRPSPAYVIVCETILQDYLGSLTLAQRVDFDGYETVRHKEDDSIYYCLKGLLKFIK